MIPPWLPLLIEHNDWNEVGAYIFPCDATIKYTEAVEQFGDGVTQLWLKTLFECEKRYQYLLNKKWSPQQARSVLPNSLKTEIIVTANFREWRHIFKLRCSKAAHPQMREIMIPLLEIVKKTIPVIFEDLGEAE